MSSDSTGEIWVLVKTSASTSAGGTTPTAAGTTPSPTQSGNAAVKWETTTSVWSALLMCIWAFV